MNIPENFDPSVGFTTGEITREAMKIHSTRDEYRKTVKKLIGIYHDMDVTLNDQNLGSNTYEGIVDKLLAFMTLYDELTEKIVYDFGELANVMTKWVESTEQAEKKYAEEVSTITNQLLDDI